MGSQTDQSPAEELISQLADAAEVVDAGGFTIDPAQARLKLRDYQLTDAHAYVLLLVEVAHLGGSLPSERAIEFRLGARSRALLRAPTRSSAEFANLLASVFSQDRGTDSSRALQLLGLALNAMLRFEDAKIYIEHVDAKGAGQRVRFDATGLAQIEAAPELEPRVPKTEHTLEPEQMRVVLDGGLFESLSRNKREAELLDTRCRYASALVRVDGRRVSRGLAWALDDPSEDLLAVRETITLNDGREIGLAGRRASGRAPELLLVVRGVLASAPPPSTSQPGLLAVVELDELRKDLAQRKVLRDAKLSALEAAVQRSDAALPPAPKPGPTSTLGSGQRRGKFKIELRSMFLFGAVCAVILLLHALIDSIPTTAIEPAAPPSPNKRLQREQACAAGEYQTCIELGREDLDRFKAAQAMTYLGPACHEGKVSAACIGLARALLAEQQYRRAYEVLDTRCMQGDQAACQVQDSPEFRNAQPENNEGLPRPRAPLAQGVAIEVRGERASHRVRVEGMRVELLLLDDEGGEQPIDALDRTRPNLPLLPRSRIMLVAQLLHPEAQHALLLGVGNASLIRFLRRYYPKLALHVVEPDARLEQTAMEAFGIFSELMLKLDLREPELAVLADPEPRYDIIYLPRFFERSRKREQGVPEPLSPEQLRGLLAPGGLLVFESGLDELDDTLAQTQESFAQVYAFRLQTHAVLFASLADERVLTRELRARAGELTERSELRLRELLHDPVF